MLSSAAASSYWRVAGMTYLKYSNLCAEMVRASLKDPLRVKAKTREAVYFRASLWEDGKPAKQCAHSPRLLRDAVICLLVRILHVFVSSTFP